MIAAVPAVSAAQLRRLVAERYASCREALLRAQASPSPTTVHRARVASRSLRSLLATLKPLLRPRLLAWARRDLRNAAAELGELREADVRRALLASLAESSAALLPVVQRQLVIELEREQAAARARLLDRLRSAAWQERLARLDHALVEARLVACSGDVGPVVRKRLRKRWKRLRHALQRRSDDADQLHELRLAVKHARYASEALMPLLERDPQECRRSLKRLQDCLGEHRDMLEAQAWLRRLGEPAGTVLLASLDKPIRRRAAGRLRQFERLAGKVSAPRL